MPDNPRVLEDPRVIAPVIRPAFPLKEAPLAKLVEETHRAKPR